MDRGAVSILLVTICYDVEGLLRTCLTNCHAATAEGWCSEPNGCYLYRCTSKRHEHRLMTPSAQFVGQLIAPQTHLAHLRVVGPVALEKVWTSQLDLRASGFWMT